MLENSFLSLVADDLRAWWGEETLYKGTVILPSSRAYLHLLEFLKQGMPCQTVLLPRRCSIGELMEQLSGYRVCDDLELLVPLHALYTQHTGNERTFTDFYYWGTTLLHDFDQIDKYRIESERFFTNLIDIKTIDAHYDYLTPEQKEVLKNLFLLFSQPSPSHEEEEPGFRDAYLTLWKALPAIYRGLHAWMHAEGVGYEGFVYRTAVEKIEASPAFVHDTLGTTARYALVGFNALNPCEQQLFLTLKQEFESRFYWKHPLRGATRSDALSHTFLQRNEKLFPNALHHQGAFTADVEPLPIRLVSVPYTIAQVQVAVEELNALHEKGVEASDIAVVLSDESLLLPLIHALPPWAQDANITMGYTLRHSVVYTLIEQFLALLSELLSPKEKATEETLKRFMLHPLVHKVLRVESEEPSWLTVWEEIQTQGFVHYPVLESAIAKAKQGALIQAMLTLLEGVYDVCSEAEQERLLTASEEGSARKPTEGYLPFAVLGEFLSAAHAHVWQLGTLLQRMEIEEHVPLLSILLSQTFRQVKASFLGDPIHSVQIMGFLETRTLDVPHVIILSCNEKFLPGTRMHTPSFLLPNLAYAFGLPSPRDRTAMYSYYFESLLAHCKSASLVYVHNASISGGLGEPSRFVHMLSLTPEHYQVEHIVRTLPLALPKKPYYVEGSQESIRQLMQTYVHKSAFSPKSLIMYHECPQRFFFHYLAQLQVPDDPQREELSALEFGEIVHDSLYMLYQPHVGTLLTPERLQSMHKSVRDVVKRCFIKARYDENKDSEATQPLTPMEELNYEIACEMVVRTLVYDEARCSEKPIFLLALEKEIAWEFTIGAQGERVKVKGRIDRVECTSDGTLIVIDYKSGRPEERKYTLHSMAELLACEKGRYSTYVMQVLCYVWLLSASELKALTSLWPEAYAWNGTIKPVLWFVESGDKKYTPSILYAKTPIDDAVQWLDSFSTHMQQMMHEMLFGTFGLTRAPHDCTYCDYQIICPKFAGDDTPMGSFAEEHVSARDNEVDERK